MLGAHLLSSPLNSHLYDQDWSDLAQTMVAHRLQTRGQSLADYAEIFPPGGHLQCKALMILMVLAFALASFCFDGRIVRSARTCVRDAPLWFVKALLCFALLLAEADAARRRRAPVPRRRPGPVGVQPRGLRSLYLRRPRAGLWRQGDPRVAAAALLAFTVGALFVGYRFVIFLITFYTT